MARTIRLCISCIAVGLMRYTQERSAHLHRTDPNLLPHVQVDKGAIKFVLSGANIMWSVCPLDLLPFAPSSRRTISAPG